MAKSVLVVGGGPAGLAAARTLGKLGIPTILVEKEQKLGGRPVIEDYHTLIPRKMTPQQVIGPFIEEVQNNPNVDVKLGVELEACEGEAPNFKVKLSNGEEHEVAAIVVATGFQHFDAKRKGELGYGIYPDVITNLELEQMFSREGKLYRPSNGQLPKRVAFVFCVGSRDRQLGVTNVHCCRYGCALSGLQGTEIREKYPDVDVFCYYMDVRTYGTWEYPFYWAPQEKHGVRYVRGRIAEITYSPSDGRLRVKHEDTIVQRPAEIPMDLVVLVLGMEPSEGTKKLAKILGLAQDPDSQFLVPAEDAGSNIVSNKAGIFIAGACKGPIDIESSLSEGEAAGAEAATFIGAKVSA
ncbi:FAD-dependent oxidoreductase [Hydrogenivirga sp. 128-5-R1-1]|uniref:FAD-dependent oxidoreductase n=1 Tax=Hydrogenivirga sp. 128-5-R1-1 TaxID=392423 RepID=UPI00015F1771|nr:FAD-dependent oxidoreductase [Hydrogenivirga sp. 128-5-R1-1]EDP76173.1 heterodisulfide reductase subunit A [Hydrogenivirga sp. 128-5-R1-1]